MQKFSGCLVTVLLFGFTFYGNAEDAVCRNRQEGWVAEIGCWGYYACSNGTLVKHTCPGAEVLDRENMTCVDPVTTTTYCGKEAVCLGRKDGTYGDATCESYITCLNGQFMGRQYCGKPLLFNEKQGYCDWKYNIDAPCTKDSQP
ncbi:uncharacterized protein LOC131953062 [Physella acuta]|uniref:uncharacterized protein LOC131953062 n=1 Tax=Physella acuta TaxID=109671 RepID=UPI0027DDAD21|nr:uncharacterized protein LOC131953062 [Physella acuta]